MKFLEAMIALHKAVRASKSRCRKSESLLQDGLKLAKKLNADFTKLYRVRSESEPGANGEGGDHLEASTLE